MRDLVDTAIAFSFPARTCGSTFGVLSNITCTWPAMRSVTAGALPLYGICVTSVCVIALNSSNERWFEVPLPVEA